VCLQALHIQGEEGDGERRVRVGEEATRPLRLLGGYGGKGQTPFSESMGCEKKVSSYGGTFGKSRQVGQKGRGKRGSATMRDLGEVRKGKKKGSV